MRYKMNLMKRFSQLFIASVVLLMAACDDEIETVLPTPLEVNVMNVEGTWRLAEWRGAPLADSTFVYMVLDRKGQMFSLYENMASMYPRLVTGKFELEKEHKQGDVIRGTYDHELGAWNHDYLVTALYAESMVWIATDDETDKQKFVRVADVPEHILEAVR
jgi:hypothetical protein